MVEAIQATTSMASRMARNKETPLAGVVFDDTGRHDYKGVGGGVTGGGGSGPIENYNYRLRFSYKPQNIGKKSFFEMDKDWKTKFVYPMIQILGPRERSKPKGGDPGYFREGFLHVQNSINKAIGDYLVMKRTGSSVSPYAQADIKLKRFPYPPYVNDVFVNAIQIQFPLIFVISFVITVLDIVKNVTVEKEKKLKESMKIMGKCFCLAV